jgi:uncharacterized Rmd1/YagE family protein
MRCVSFCAAGGYRLIAAANFFKTNHYTLKLYRNKVLHASKPDNHFFIFSHGCCVTWGLKRREEQELLKQLQQFAIQPMLKVESDFYVFRYGKRTGINAYKKFNIDIITLPTKENTQIKLAISYGLAQSAKLASYESSIQEIIDSNSSLSGELAKTGSIPLSRKAISKRIGEIFLARSSINLNSEYLEVPEYFWEYSSSENYYLMIEKFLDIRRRATVLNNKLDVVQDLVNMLSNQLQHRYSAFLETIIILLILFEIIISLMHF